MSHAIARELQDEMGHEPALAVVPGDGAGSGNSDAPRGAPEALRKLETRVERVERTVGATVDLLHGLLHPDKSKPGATTER